jgi:hypothetical protein
VSELIKTMNSHVSKISDIVMQNHFDFVGYKPSIIAAAIIERARA